MKEMQTDHNNISEHRQELKLRILRTAMPLFKQRGIKAVKMDDIAAALSISKRTLYEVYDKKEDLLLAGVRHDHEELLRHIQEYALTAENEIDIVVTFFKLKFADLDNLSPLFLTELEKYDKVTAYLRSRHEEQQRESLLFVKRCIENGYFVPELNYEILQDICDSMMDASFKKALYEKYSLSDIFCNFFIVLLRGFCTEKGILLLDQYLKKTED